MPAPDPNTIGPLGQALPRADYVRIVMISETDLAGVEEQMVEKASAGDSAQYRCSAHVLEGAAGATGALRQEDQTPRRDMQGRIGAEARPVLSELAS